MSVLMTTLRQTVKATVDNVKSNVVDKVAPPDTPPATGDPPKPAPPSNPVRTVLDGINAVKGVLSMPIDLMNNGFAAATSGISDVVPAFPAACMLSLYVGPLHSHVHPPSLIPPAPPIPLPSIGNILIGCSPTVLISGKPAARAGDIGFAPTCGGFMPGFEIITGSSKVFIRGTRAARMLDFGRACTKAEFTSMRAAVMAQITTGNALAMAGIAASAIDSANATDPNVAAAQGLAAAAGAADMAAGIAAGIVSALLGSDPGVPPGGMGTILIPGSMNVMIGGFPMPNFPDPAAKLFGKLKNKAKAAYKKAKDKRQAKKQKSCKDCG